MSTQYRTNTPEPLKEPVPQEQQPHQTGHKEWPVAYQVFPNEKALLLVERHEQATDSKGFRRYQTIFVERNQQLAKYMEDMGLALAFTSSSLSIPGGDPSRPASEWFHTVAELKAYADDFRAFLLERQITREMPDLAAGYHDDIDMERRERRRLSQVGPAHRILRSY